MAKRTGTWAVGGTAFPEEILWFPTWTVIKSLLAKSVVQARDVSIRDTQ